MDLRYFELHDILCEAMIALEAGNYAAAAAIVQKALKQVEADWLATPSELPARSGPSLITPDGPDDEE